MVPVLVPSAKVPFLYSDVQNSFSMLYKAILNAYVKKYFYDLNFYIFSI